LQDSTLVMIIHDWATVCKTVRPMLSVCLSVCPVCNVGVFWPNSWNWMDQDETWYGGLDRPMSHCVVRWGSSSLLIKGHSPQFSVHVCCGQTARWIKMSLGAEVGVGPGHIVLDGDPAPPPKKGGTGHSSLPLFGPCLLWPNDRLPHQLLSSCF